MNQQANIIDLQQQTAQDARSALDEIVREGARRMLQAAIEAEVAAYIEAHQDLRDDQGHRLVVRNGHLPEREVLTGTGPLTVKKPRVNDRRDGQRFTSAILPPYLRRSPSIDALIPCLSSEGQRSALHLLRFSGGALEAASYDQSDRVYIYDSTAPDATDEGVWRSAGDSDDGLQVGAGGGEEVATVGRITVYREGASRCPTYRRRRAGRRPPGGMIAVEVRVSATFAVMVPV